MKTYWYLTRASGAVALILLTLSLIVGIAAIGRVHSRRWPRFAIDGVHRTSSLLAIVFLAVHIATAVLDSFAPISLLDSVIPFAGAYRPLWLGLGATAFDLLLAVAITSGLRNRLGYRRWRATHWLAYGVWPLAVLHGLGTGSDVHQGWMTIVYVGCAAAVLVAALSRIAIGWPTAVRWRLTGLGAIAAFGLGDRRVAARRAAGSPLGAAGRHAARRCCARPPGREPRNDPAAAAVRRHRHADELRPSPPGPRRAASHREPDRAGHHDRAVRAARSRRWRIPAGGQAGRGPPRPRHSDPGRQRLRGRADERQGPRAADQDTPSRARRRARARPRDRCRRDRDRRRHARRAGRRDDADRRSPSVPSSPAAAGRRRWRGCPAATSAARRARWSDGATRGSPSRRRPLPRVTERGIAPAPDARLQRRDASPTWR